jgi:hypothetical protein
VSTDYLLGRDAAGPPHDLPGAAQSRRRPQPRRPAARTNGHTQAPVPALAEPQPARMCPHCRMPMQPLGDGARRTCPGCHYTVADDT